MSGSGLLDYWKDGYPHCVCSDYPECSRVARITFHIETRRNMSHADETAAYLRLVPSVTLRAVMTERLINTGLNAFAAETQPTLPSVERAIRHL